MTSGYTDILNTLFKQNHLQKHSHKSTLHILNSLPCVIKWEKKKREELTFHGNPKTQVVNTVHKLVFITLLTFRLVKGFPFIVWAMTHTLTHSHSKKKAQIYTPPLIKHIFFLKNSTVFAISAKLIPPKLYVTNFGFLFFFFLRRSLCCVIKHLRQWIQKMFSDRYQFCQIIFHILLWDYKCIRF